MTTYSPPEIAAQLLGAGFAAARAEDDRAPAVLRQLAETTVIESYDPAGVEDMVRVIQHLGMTAGVVVDLWARQTGADPATVIRGVVSALSVATAQPGAGSAPRADPASMIGPSTARPPAHSLRERWQRVLSTLTARRLRPGRNVRN